MKILVVDDDLELLGLIGFALRQAGYLVLEASDGRAALATFAREQPDLVILDVNLPELSGFEVCRQIRAEAATLVMLLTVRSSEEDQVRGLDGGADDYLTKPFSPRTLLARVRALLRRAEIDRPTPLTTGDLALDPERQAVSVRGAAPVRLTSLEFRLLHLLANAGHDHRRAADQHAPRLATSSCSNSLCTTAPEARAEPRRAAVHRHHTGVGYLLQA